MLLVTAGGWAQHYSARGISGPIDDLLFPINHGILHYPGFDVLPAFVSYRVDRLDERGFAQTAHNLREQMKTAASMRPIPFRRQNGGDYSIPALELCDSVGSSDALGFSLHLSDKT